MKINLSATIEIQNLKLILLGEPDMSQPRVLHGRKSGIGTSAVQLTATSSKVRLGVEVWAPASNGYTLYGAADSAVTADAADATSGGPIVPGGQKLFIPIDDPSKVYIIGPSGASGQKVYWQAA